MDVPAALARAIDRVNEAIGRAVSSASVYARRGPHAASRRPRPGPNLLSPGAGIHRGIVPFVLIQLFGLALLALLPGLATWLGEAIFG